MGLATHLTTCGPHLRWGVRTIDGATKVHEVRGCRSHFQNPFFLKCSPVASDGKNLLGGRLPSQYEHEIQ